MTGVEPALWLLCAQGVLGAFDTLYFHEYRARLPAGGAQSRAELRLHALRDFIYAVLFVTLPWAEPHGGWAWLFGLLIAAEIIITMADFAVEVRTRGESGVPAGERITHGLMAIIYGGVLAHVLPLLWAWSQQPSGWEARAAQGGEALAWTMTVMGVGVLLSGIRDAIASR